MNIFKKLFAGKEIEELKDVKQRLNELEELAKDPKKEATDKGEPYINILEIEMDPNSTGIGSFELDWNHYFIKYLKTNGYTGESDEQIVDKWFQDVCRNVVLETYEQHAAQNKTYVQKRKIDDNRTEIG